MNVWMFPYSPNPKLKEAIKIRLIKLLQVEKPLEVITLLIEEKKKEYPDLEESLREDLVMQDLIIKHKDEILDQLWHLYNIGYTLEDTKKFVERYSVSGYNVAVDAFLKSIEDD